MADGSKRSAEHLDQLRRDAADSCRFVREALLICVRLNPIRIAAQRFCEIIGTITADTTRPVVVEITGNALKEALPACAFIGTAGRQGVNYDRILGKVVEQLNEKLGCHAIRTQLAISTDIKLEGVVDLIRMKALCVVGNDIREDAIPTGYQQKVSDARHKMLEELSMYSDTLMTTILEGKTPTEDEVHAVAKAAILENSLTHVFFDSALTNNDLQPQGACDPDALGKWPALAAGVVRDVVLSDRIALDKCGLPWQRHIDHAWILEPDHHAAWLSQHLAHALSGTLSDADTIREHLLQLVEFYPRYRKVMSKAGGGILNFVVGFGAAYLGGALGVMGAEAWEQWQNKSDNEFLQAFAAAVTQFAQKAFEITQNTEAAVTPVIEQFVMEMSSRSENVIRGLAALADSGHSLEGIFRSLHLSEDALIGDAAEFVELAIANLRTQGLSYESERNMREMWGLMPEVS